jgi:hypothetical protein
MTPGKQQHFKTMKKWIVLSLVGGMLVFWKRSFQESPTTTTIGSHGIRTPIALAKEKNKKKEEDSIVNQTLVLTDQEPTKDTTSSNTGTTNVVTSTGAAAPVQHVPYQLGQALSASPRAKIFLDHIGYTVLIADRGEGKDADGMYVFTYTVYCFHMIKKQWYQRGQTLVERRDTDTDSSYGVDLAEDSPTLLIWRRSSNARNPKGTQAQAYMYDLATSQWIPKGQKLYFPRDEDFRFRLSGDGNTIVKINYDTLAKQEEKYRFVPCNDVMEIYHLDGFRFWKKDTQRCTANDVVVHSDVALYDFWVSHDGRRIAFETGSEESVWVYIIEYDYASRSWKPVLEQKNFGGRSEVDPGYSDMSSDGSTLLVSGFGSWFGESPGDLQIFHIDTETKELTGPQILEFTDRDPESVRLSSDSRTVTVLSRPLETYELFFNRYEFTVTEEASQWILAERFETSFKPRTAKLSGDGHVVAHFPNAHSPNSDEEGMVRIYRFW